MIEISPREPNNKFKFRYQKDENFQALIEQGIGHDLSDSGFCWAACVDMSLSPSVPEPIRLQIIINAVKHEKLNGNGFKENGALYRHKLEDFVDIINGTLTAQKLPSRLKYIPKRKLEDYHIELLKGRRVIFGLGNEIYGHMMIMDKVYHNEGNYYYSVWNPAIANPSEANSTFDSYQLYGRQLYADMKYHPFIISVGERE